MGWVQHPSISHWCASSTIQLCECTQLQALQLFTRSSFTKSLTAPSVVKCLSWEAFWSNRKMCKWMVKICKFFIHLKFYYDCCQYLSNFIEKIFFFFFLIYIDNWVVISIKFLQLKKKNNQRHNKNSIFFSSTEMAAKPGQACRCTWIIAVEGIAFHFPVVAVLTPKCYI